MSYLLNTDIADLSKNNPRLFGSILENFVAIELSKQLTFSDMRVRLYHYRTSSGQEVDFILEGPENKICAIKDAEGKKFSTNQETDGRFHSKWINMMYPRLFLARNLLREDGVIFISIDDNEVTNLRKICDEIFGEENFVGGFVWRKKAGAGADSKLFFRQHEHILLYGKYSENLKALFQPLTKKQKEEYKNPDNDPRGLWAETDLTRTGDKDPRRTYEVVSPTGKIYKHCWAYTEVNFQELIKQNLVWWGKNGDKKPKRKRFLENKEGLTPRSWIDVVLTSEGKKDLKLINFDEFFDYPKPVQLIKLFINIGMDKDSITLDFFAGSATTAHAVYKKNLEDGGNRKYICVQLPEPTQEDTEAFKAGYKTITDIGKERIRRAIKKIKEDNKQQSLLDQNKNNLDLGFKVFKLDKSNFKIWEEEVSKDKSTSEQVEMHLEDFVNPKSSEEDLLYEILIKTGFQLTTKIKVLKLDNKTVYSVEDNVLLICLDKKITKELIAEMAKLKPARVVCLDVGFENKDHLKTNAMETFTSHGVRDFKTV